MTQVVAQDGTRIHYTAEGTGPTIVLLHGLSADGEMNWEWTGIAPALRAAGFRTVAVIQRGRVGAPFDLDAITVPTLVIVGEDDDLSGNAEALAHALTNATFERVPGDHASALIEPAFIAALVNFARATRGT